MSVHSLATRIAELSEATETGQWQRHAAPTSSVVVEAYRHVVDPIVFDDPADRDRFVDGLLPRVLVTCTVNVGGLVDLRTATARAATELTMQDLQSPMSDKDAYRRCQEVAHVAHQLGRCGILTPAATGLGDTLALFTDRRTVAERPVRSLEDVQWARLPPDPRLAAPTRRRIIRGEG